MLLLLYFASGYSQSPSDFIKIDGKKFKCGYSDFFPVAINYATEICHVTGSTPTANFPDHFPARYHAYYPSNTQASAGVTSQTDAYNIMVKDFTDMYNKGFNTVRVVGAPCFKQYQAYQSTTPPTSYPAVDSWDLTGNDEMGIDISSNFNLLLDITQNILDAAAQANMRVIILAAGQSVIPDPTSPSAFTTAYVSYLSAFAQRFKNNPTLLAVEFTHEMEFGTYPNYTKTQVCQLTKTWNDAIKGSSDILTTVGSYYLISSTQHWDANVENVDFASFHPYQEIHNCSTDLSNAIEKVKSTFLWAKNNLSLPWMVGELAVTAHPLQTSCPLTSGLDPSSYAVDLTQQGQFLDETIRACRDYGGAGYAWWGFMDESYSATGGGGPYWALAETNNGSSTITWKPAANYISSFSPVPDPLFDAVTPPSNYYNFDNLGSTYSAAGQVTYWNGSANVPLKDAVVIATNTSYNQIGMTFTDASGNFTLYSSGLIYILTVTGVDCNLSINYVPSMANITGLSYSLTKIDRPTTTNITNSGSSIYSAAVSQYATNDITFSNYGIYSGTFTSKAGSQVQMSTGFSAKSGATFKASIGPYYHDCSDLTDGTTPFRTEAPVKTLTKQDTLGSFSIYPNPGTGHYTMTFDKEGDYTLDVLNMYGSKIRTASFRERKKEINISDISNGVYMFEIKENGQPKYRQKVIKQ